MRQYPYVSNCMTLSGLQLHSTLSVITVVSKFQRSLRAYHIDSALPLHRCMHCASCANRFRLRASRIALRTEPSAYGQCYCLYVYGRPVVFTCSLYQRLGTLRKVHHLSIGRFLYVVLAIWLQNTYGAVGMAGWKKDDPFSDISFFCWLTLPHGCSQCPILKGDKWWTCWYCATLRKQGRPDIGMFITH